MVNEIIHKLVEEKEVEMEDAEEAVQNFNTAIGKGILKIMNKIGISTLHSYRGAQIFEILGLNEKFVNKYFCNTPTRIEGIGLYEIENEVQKRHTKAFKTEAADTDLDLDIGEITDGDVMGKTYV